MSDIIFALASAKGRAGVSIIRISGANSICSLEKLVKEKLPVDGRCLRKIYDLENNIIDAVQQIDKLIEEFSPSALIGSSLGGFYATYFSEQYNLKCVGINPAVIPPAEMSEYLGENKNYSTGEKFLITQEQLDLLDRMGGEIKVIKCPGNFMILLQSHDEKLDYRLSLIHI